MAKVVVIGGGAAGLMASGRAAECGAEVTLIERGPICGRKLRIAGKGRANITNATDMKDFIAAFGDNGKFLYGAFSRFSRDDLISLFSRLGVPVKTERGGRIFPVSDDANEVADSLVKWIARLGVNIRLNTRAKRILLKDGRVAGVETWSAPEEADRIVLATGGITYPRTGSTGDGYEIARSLGHTIIPIRPSLTAMVSKEPWVRDLQGLSLRNVEVKLFSIENEKRKLVSKQFGEMIFTHFGVSGPIILTLSRKVADLLGKSKLELSIDLKPALSEEQLNKRLLRDFVGAKHFINYLPELLPRKMIKVFISFTDVTPNTPLCRITSLQRKKILQILKDFRITIVALRPPDEAIVTAGGVSIKEIDPRTMQSILIPGLYFAGEVVDVDAVTGGFNLQGAFSMGWVAGESAALGK